MTKLAYDTRGAGPVLVLLHAEELSVREIAQLTGWSEAKVKIRAFRARQAGRRAIQRVLSKKKGTSELVKNVE